MNSQQLQEEYDRLCRRIKALNQQPAAAVDPAEWRELVENLELLTSGTAASWLKRKPKLRS